MAPQRPDSRDPEQRPDPDALLAQVAAAEEQERRGRLKVFLGAAPGVGKTYAMLNAAREMRRQGKDVVVGIVETHGRAETQALLEGLEALPRQSLEYKGKTFEELDVDALLRRHPEVALVDELAHSNAPGSRHQRRYQDVEDLLDAGIDVYTTLNVQHFESLNDVVEQLTGVRVRETVPDAFFDRPHEIVLIDLPPRELIERLRQGKVYVPEQARTALQSFFSPVNLAALRELAMQTAADRVDADLREYLLAHGAPQGTPIRRRVLVAVDDQAHAEYLVRVARRIAERLQAPWTVAYVETGNAHDRPREPPRRLPARAAPGRRDDHPPRQQRRRGDSQLRQPPRSLLAGHREDAGAPDRSRSRPHDHPASAAGGRPLRPDDRQYALLSRPLAALAGAPRAGAREVQAVRLCHLCHGRGDSHCGRSRPPAAGSESGVGLSHGGGRRRRAFTPVRGCLHRGPVLLLLQLLLH